MKVRVYSIGLILCTASWLTVSYAQMLPEILHEVLRNDTAYHSLSCTMNIKLDVPGLDMPEKEVELQLERGKKPQIKGEGITVLPRHGILGQYRKFLDVDCQSIPISVEGDTIVFKVVSLDKKTDWVTADFELTQRDVRIHSMLISTRKHGEYLVRHFYGPNSEFFPEQSEISFEAMPLKLPLKFMGKQERKDLKMEEKGPLSQKDICSDLLFEKSNISKIVRKLQESKLIRMSFSAEDSRISIVEITKHGRSIVNKCMKMLNTWKKVAFFFDAVSISVSMIHSLVCVLKTPLQKTEGKCFWNKSPPKAAVPTI